MALDFKRDHHILSRAIIASACVNVVAALMITYCRIALMKQVPAFLPVMEDDVIWNDQTMVSAVQLVLVAVIFLIARYRLGRRSRFMKVGVQTSSVQTDAVQESVVQTDTTQPSTVQTDTAYAGSGSDRYKTLSIQSVSELIEIWAVILLGVGFVYDISANMYRKFVTQIGSLIGSDRDSSIEEAVVAVYNGTHGFKYVGMFTAIILGIIVTAIFLKDKKLIITAAVLTAAFLIAFAFLSIQTITISGNQYGIVWTSVIFHALDTIGLMVLGIYIKQTYKGI